MSAVTFQSGLLLDVVPGQQLLVASLVVDILVLGLVTLGVVITDEAVVETDSLVVPHTGEIEVRVGAGLTVLPRSQTTLEVCNKIFFRSLFFC